MYSISTATRHPPSELLNYRHGLQTSIRGGVIENSSRSSAIGLPGTSKSTSTRIQGVIKGSKNHLMKRDSTSELRTESININEQQVESPSKMNLKNERLSLSS